jgi:methyl-accepting chemotaxis protein
MKTWSFGRKLGLGFASVVGLALLAGVITLVALRSVAEAKDRALHINARGLVDAQRLENGAERCISAVRGFLITSENSYLEQLAAARAELDQLMSTFAQRGELELQIRGVRDADLEFRRVTDSTIAAAQRGATKAEISQLFLDDMRPRRQRLTAALGALTERENQGLEAATEAAARATANAMALALTVTLAALAIAAAAAVVLTRTLGRQIGGAVSQVQSSSTELQAAATQQATGLREQATAMAEITTTISELLTTSRQIADSAQRVAAMALETGGSARQSDDTVIRANESFAGIQRQVELIVQHMLELGRKSQQIGGVVEIVAELAEQTNILAINATIEATGAGEAGRRFAVVADEIRKLADRVGGSTKEIRSLIDDVRAAVNTTVMVTETGSKTVEAGSRQFGEVTASLRQISGLAGTTSEAAREIELSTKQQTTAVEQVNQAIANVAQVSREAEASAQQTLDTAAQLAQLSRELMDVVQPQAA